MRALILSRVSSDEQAEHGYSLAAQEQACREAAERAGALEIALYRDDGYSAATMDRPALQRMLREIRLGDAILVHRLDRLSRSIEDTAILLRRIAKAGARVVSVTEGPIDVSTASGLLNAGVRSVFNAYERAVIGERAAAGIKRRIVNEGKPPAARPYGYRTDTPDWAVDPDLAPIIQQIYTWRLDGATYNGICRRLDQTGHPPPRRRAYWHSYSVMQILANPAYAGYRRFKGQIVGNGIPPIIEEETWRRVQLLNAARKTARTREATDYLLSGLVWCSCGYRMGPYRRRQKRARDGKVWYWPVYKCVANVGRPGIGHSHSITARKLDPFVLGQLDALAAGEEAPHLVLPEPPRVDTAARLAALDRELEALEVHLLGGRIRPEAFDGHKTRIEQARQEALAKADNHSQTAARQAVMAQEVRRITGGGLVRRYEAEGVTPALKAAVQQVVARIEVMLPEERRPGPMQREVRIALRSTTGESLEQ